MASMGYTPGGAGGYAPPSMQYDPNNPVGNTAFQALNNYNSNANNTSSWLSNVLASNQNAQQQAAQGALQQAQAQQDTAASAAGPGGAMQGAALGTSILPGWGTAAGAVIGGALGSAKDYAYRTQKMPWYQALGQTFLDAINPVNSFNAITGMAGGQSSTGANLAKAGQSLNKPSPAASQMPMNSLASQAYGQGGTSYSAVPGMAGQGSVSQTGNVGNNSFNPTPAPTGAQGNQWYMDSSGTWQPSYNNPMYSGSGG